MIWHLLRPNRGTLCCALQWNHTLLMKRYSWISSCVRVYGCGKKSYEVEGARQLRLLRCQPGCAQRLEQSLSTSRPKCVLYTPLPADSLGSLHIHCRGPAKIIKHNNFHMAAGWNVLQVVKAMENPCDSDMSETTPCSERGLSGEYPLPYWLRHLVFLVPGVLQSPSSTQFWALPHPRQSHNSHKPQLPSELELGRHCHI